MTTKRRVLAGFAVRARSSSATARVHALSAFAKCASRTATGDAASSSAATSPVPVPDTRAPTTPVTTTAALDRRPDQPRAAT
jgi:hypothetical protein